MNSTRLDAHGPLVKSGYKQTDVGVIPEEWDAVSVGTLAAFTSGGGISVAELSELSSDTPVPVFGGNGIAGYTSCALVSDPVVIVGRVGQKCGEVYLTDGPAWITDNALYPRIIRRRLDIRFLAMALKAAGLNNVKNRNDLPLVTQSILHSVRIPWPADLREQRAIAEALSDADTLLGALDRLIAKKRDLKQAVMQQLLTGQTRLPGFHGEWEVKRLGDVIEEIGDGATPSTGDSANFGGSINWVVIDDIKDEITTTKTTLTERGLRACAATLWNPGTLIVSTGATIGEVGIARIRVATKQGICGLVFDQAQAVTAFLKYWFVQNKCLLLSKAQGSTIKEVRAPTLVQFEISLPILSEQTAIAEVLGEMDAELAGWAQRREKTRDLKQAMMQELLTGRTRLV